MHLDKISKILLFVFCCIFYTNAFAEEDKEFINNYGPVTVCADKLVYNDKDSTLIYYGKVFIMQIKNKNIYCHLPKKGDKTSSNDAYFPKNKSESFSDTQKKWLRQAQKVCNDTKECNFITGQKLTIQLDSKGKVESFTMDIKDNNIVKFYSYPRKEDNSRGSFKGLMYGEGEQAIYSLVDDMIYLKKNAIVTQGDSLYKGDELDYDITHGMIGVPSSGKKRSQLVLDGFSDNTRVQVGQKISDSVTAADRKRGRVNFTTY